MRYLTVATLTFAVMLILVGLLGSMIQLTHYGMWTGRIGVVALSIMPPLASHLGRRFGFKQMLLVGIALLGIGSLCTGLMEGFWPLFCSRALAGLGGGILLTVSLAIVRWAVPKEERRVAILLHTNCSFGPGIAIGLFLGGHLTQQTFNLLVAGCALVAFVASALFVKNHQRTQSTFDWLGYALYLIGLGFLLFAATEEESWELLVGLAFWALFVWRSLTVKEPILALKLLGKPHFAIVCAAEILVGMMIFGITALSIGMLERLFGMDRAQVGLLMSQVGLIYFVTGFLPAIWKMPRFWTIAGLGLIAISCFISPGITLESSHWALSLRIGMRAAGVGLTIGPLTVLALMPFQKNLHGDGSAMVNFFRFLGAIFGSAIVLLLWGDEGDLPDFLRAIWLLAWPVTIILFAIFTLRIRKISKE